MTIADHQVPFTKEARVLRSTFSVIAYVIGLSIGEAGCAVLDGAEPHDLRFISTEIVDLKDRADVVWLSREPRPSRPMVMVSISTAVDLAAYAHQHEYNIGNVASICNEGKVDQTMLLQKDSYVYDDMGKVDAFRESGPNRMDAEPSNKIYHMYFNIKPIALAGRTDVFAYDLKQNPEDICFELLGGNMLGSKFASNVLVVPKAALVSALTRAEQQ